MSDVTITSITIIDRPAPERGHTLLAYFDAHLLVVKLIGCRLLRLDDGRLRAWPPSMPGPRGQRHAVFITDIELSNDMRAAAIHAYRALGGVLDLDVELASVPDAADGADG